MKKITALNPTTDVNYIMKENNDNIYFVKEEFNESNLLIYVYNDPTVNIQYTKVSGEQLATDPIQQKPVTSVYYLPDQRNKEIRIVDQADFNSLNDPESSLRMIKVKDFQSNYDELHELAQENQISNSSETPDMNFTQRVFAYDNYNSIFSGFEFMGFFLESPS